MSARYQVVSFRTPELARAMCDFYCDEPVEGSGRFLLVLHIDGTVDRSLHPWAVEADQIGQAAVALHG